MSNQQTESYNEQVKEKMIEDLISNLSDQIYFMEDEIKSAFLNHYDSSLESIPFWELQILHQDHCVE